MAALLNVGQVAGRLGVSRGVVTSALTSGALSGYRVGRSGKRGSRRVSEADLDAWVLGMRAGPEPPPPKAQPPPAKAPRLVTKHLSLD